MADLSERMFKAIDPETSPSLPPYHNVNEPNLERKGLYAPLANNPKARELLLTLNAGFIKTLMPGEDTLISKGFSMEEAQDTTSAFEDYCKTHADEIEALRIIYNNSGEPLTYSMLRDLSVQLRRANSQFNVSQLWNCYSLLNREKVKPRSTQEEKEALTFNAMTLSQRPRTISSTSRINMKSEVSKEMRGDLLTDKTERQFSEVVDIILSHRSRASQAVNNELLLTAWHVGSYVSAKLKSEEWGSKVVSRLSEYIRAKRPELKGYSRRSIYNMMMFYDEYSSAEFADTVMRFLNSEFVQPKTGQLQSGETSQIYGKDLIVQTESAQFIPVPSGQLPKILELTTLSNHLEILSRCRSLEERMFYILYASKEHLTNKELKRCISNQTFSTLLGSKKSMSKRMLETYPNAQAMFKDTLFFDFLNLPKKHSESKLKTGSLEHDRKRKQIQKCYI